MAQLFAAYLTQKMVPDPVSGAYDPEQELWVGDNQLLGATQTSKRTTRFTGTYGGPGVTDHDTEPDTVSDSDNP